MEFNSTYCFLKTFSQDSQHQQQSEQNNAAMALINSVAGVDEEGRSRQRILTFAARRYYNQFLSSTLYILGKNSHERPTFYLGNAFFIVFIWRSSLPIILFN